MTKRPAGGDKLARFLQPPAEREIAARAEERSDQSEG